MKYPLPLHPVYTMCAKELQSIWRPVYPADLLLDYIVPGAQSSCQQG